MTCDYCGIKWYRSVCVRDASNYLACPDCEGGRDWVSCDRANQAGATAPTWRPRPGWDP